MITRLPEPSLTRDDNLFRWDYGEGHEVWFRAELPEGMPFGPSELKPYVLQEKLTKPNEGVWDDSFILRMMQDGCDRTYAIVVAEHEGFATV